ncbi:BnaA02g24000D [Brassica napus]|uniref:BnaA02g24000D protein n=3 Tax=Brassica TaxID=3705 RepID=A0A078GIQ0_BRANA|nr:BnaA02g24000D [Brassica napus]
MHSTERSEDGLDGKISVLKNILTVLGVEVSILVKINKYAVDEYKSNMESEVESKKHDAETAKEKEISALLYALHLNLRWKKYLIVFDDVREEDNWNEKLQDDEEKLKKDKRWGKYLSDGFPKGSGGRVIYTTRDENKNLAKKLVAEEHEIHRLWPLTDSLSVWRIYDAARIENEEDDPPRNDKKCIEELMNKSRGLPLAVRLLATLLPVFLDDESTEQNGSTNGTTGSENTTTEQNGSTQPPTA